MVTFGLSIPSETLEHLDLPAPDPGLHTFIQTVSVECPLVDSVEGRAGCLHLGP